MHKTILFHLVLLVIFTSCKNSPPENNKKSDVNIDTNGHSNTMNSDLMDVDSTLTKENSDTTLKNNELISVKDWKIEDFIINKKDKKSTSLKSNIEYDKEEWKNVKSPFIASYKGCDFGDYFHVNFEDANGKTYDFGHGENDFGAYKLYNKTDFTDNPKYLGKSFKIYWNWKISSFPCCDGEYDMVKAYQPSITKLELIGK